MKNIKNSKPGKEKLGKIEIVIVSILLYLFLIYIFFINPPDYLDPLYARELGVFAISLATVSLMIGVLAWCSISKKV